MFSGFRHHRRHDDICVAKKKILVHAQPITMRSGDLFISKHFDIYIN
jgi:hypothetical protein